MKWKLLDTLARSSVGTHLLPCFFVIQHVIIDASVYLLDFQTEVSQHGFYLVVISWTTVTFMKHFLHKGHIFIKTFVSLSPLVFYRHLLHDDTQQYMLIARIQ